MDYSPIERAEEVLIDSQVANKPPRPRGNFVASRFLSQRRSQKVYWPSIEFFRKLSSRLTDKYDDKAHYYITIQSAPALAFLVGALLSVEECRRLPLLALLLGDMLALTIPIVAAYLMKYDGVCGCYDTWAPIVAAYAGWIAQSAVSVMILYLMDDDIGVGFTILFVLTLAVTFPWDGNGNRGFVCGCARSGDTGEGCDVRHAALRRVGEEASGVQKALS